MGTRRVPKPWSFGISFSATLGSFTRSRILRATKSLTSAFASRLVSMSRKLPCHMANPGRRVLLLEEGFALLGRHLEGAARIGGVDEAGEGFLAAPEHFVIVSLDPDLRRGVDGAVVQRLAPVGRALEHREMSGGLGDLGDGLHTRGAGADDGDALAREAHRLVRPARGVERLPLESVDALDARQGRSGQRADGGDEEAGAMAAAVVQRHGPGAGVVLPVGGGDAAAELDVAAEVELVGDVVEIAQGLGLAGEVLRPVPFLQQLLARRRTGRCSFPNRSGRRDSGSSTRCRRRRCRPRIRARSGPARAGGRAGTCRRCRRR